MPNCTCVQANIQGGKYYEKVRSHPNPGTGTDPFLAACGGNPAPTDTPVPPTPSPAPSEPAAEETVYTTVINEADVTFTVSADQKSIAVDTMGMTVKGACEVADNVLTFGDRPRAMTKSGPA